MSRCNERSECKRTQKTLLFPRGHLCRGKPAGDATSSRLCGASATDKYTMLRIQHEKQGCKNWDYCDDIATFVLLCVANYFVRYQFIRARSSPLFTFYAGMVRTMVVRIFCIDVGAVMAFGYT